MATAAEFRGTRAWVWVDRTRASFAPFAGSQGRWEIQVPIGWALAPHPEHGIVLVPTCGPEVTALGAIVEIGKLNGLFTAIGLDADAGAGALDTAPDYRRAGVGS